VALGDGRGEGLTPGEAEGLAPGALGEGVVAGEGDGVGVVAGDGVGDGDGEGGVEGEGEADGSGLAVGEGEGAGVGGGVGGGTQASTTACGSSCAVRPVGGGGGAWMVSDTTGLSAEASPRTFARAATRTIVPTGGRTSLSTRLSPGATRRRVVRASFAKSPGASVRNSSTSSTPRRAPPAVVRGAT
jgi:hypothetical protein